MPPAFSSFRQAATFALLLLILLMLPVIMRQPGMSSREEIYSALDWQQGPYPYIRQQIFEEKGDIDIAFIGSSHLLDGIDTPYVQRKLSERLGRQAVVRTFGWGGSGFDNLYFVTKDLLEHRKVHLLVFYDEYHSDQINTMATHWFRFEDDPTVLSGLSLRDQATYYFAAIMGTPRDLLGLVRPSIPLDLFSEQPNFLESYWHMENPAGRLGSASVHLAFDVNSEARNPNFKAFTVQKGASPSAEVVYSSKTRAEFQFLDKSMPAWQVHFARKLAALAREKQTHLFMLDMPVIPNMKSTVVQEDVSWPDVLRADITMAGIPGSILYSGLSEEDVHKLYYDPGHMNENGQSYFTPIVTPTLLDIYVSLH